MKNRCYALLVEIRSYGGDRRARSDDRESFDENLLCGMRLQKLRFVMIWPISSLATLATAISGSSTTRRRNAGVLQIRNSLNMTRNGEWFHPRRRKTRAPTLYKAIIELAYIWWQKWNFNRCCNAYCNPIFFSLEEAGELCQYVLWGAISNSNINSNYQNFTNTKYCSIKMCNYQSIIHLWLKRFFLITKRIQNWTQ